MHIKFLNHGQGSAAAAVRYLLQERDHNGEVRAEVSVLRGDPTMVALVADASANQWRYTSGIISWAPEDQPTPEEIAQVVEDWEATAFAGLEADQFASCAVLHRDDDGTPHIHTLTARVELKTGKALNIAPPSHQKTFDPLRDHWNHKMGWARPDDPDRARNVQLGHESKGRSKPDKHPRNRAEITEHIEALAAEGLLTTAAEVRQELSGIGEITRASHAYISVKPPGAEKAIRLKGDLFRDNWTIEQTLERTARRAQREAVGRAGRADPGAAKRARKRLTAVTQRRAEYNRERYTQPERAPDLSIEHRREATDAADREYREEAVDRSGPGRAVESIGRPSELDAHDGHHSGRDVSRGRRDGGRLGHSRPTDRQPLAAAGDTQARDPASGVDASVGRSSGSSDDRRSYVSDRRDVDRQHERWAAGHPTDSGKGLSNDRAGNPIVTATRAAAARLREAVERAVSTARALADISERAAAAKPGITSGADGERREARQGHRLTDSALKRADSAVEQLGQAVEGVTSAYEAWQARKQERERQDQERQQRSAQYVPPALREAFADELPDSKPDQPKQQKQEKSHRWTPNNGGPGL